MAVQNLGKQSGPGIVGRLLKSRELSVVAVLALLCLGMAFTEQRANFFGPLNMTNIVQQVALLSLFAIGETIVIITSGIDLSLGSIIAFAGMLVALFVNKFSEGLIEGPAEAATNRR